MWAGPGPWEVAALLSKSAIYVAMITVIGAGWMRALMASLAFSSASSSSASGREFSDGSNGPFIQGRCLIERLCRWQLLAACGGLVFTSLWFLTQVGAINQQGLPGMFDATMVDVLDSTTIGSGSRLKAWGFALALVSAVLLNAKWERRGSRALSSLAALLMVLSAALLAWSFAVLGHVAPLGPIASLAIVVHVLVISAWTGSLYPLLASCRLLQPAQLLPLMQRFGHWAAGLITLLLLAGIYLSVQLLGSVSELFGTAYGWSLLLKLLLVSGLLGLGALNRLRLVPALAEAGQVQPLQRSIRLEMVVAAAVLAVTAWLTTVVGPSHTM